MYFELTANGIRAVPEDAADSFRRSILPFQLPSYNGVSLTFAEATEIVRKNEAVRQMVIRRECPSSGDCGGAVHAAATALVSDTEAASARKLGHLVEIAAQRSAAPLVLVTAGWPYRDERAMRFDAIVRDLQASGATLTVLRVPANIAYRGLVKDASERLASRLSAPFIALDDEADVARARRGLAGGSRAAGYPRVQVPRAAPEALAPRSDEDRSMPAGMLDATLRRAAAYVTRFVGTFSGVIWRERYEQEDRVPRKFNASGTSFSTVAARRALDSELLLVWLPKDAGWIAVRDVVAIDGKPRPNADRQLQGLLNSQSVAVDQLRKLAAENGRFNIGGIVHTFGTYARFDVLVPLEMREWYTSATGEEVTTTATYRDFRRFETAGRLIVPK